LDFGGCLPKKLFPAIDLFLKQDYTPFNKHKSYFSNISGLVILRPFDAFDGILLCLQSIVGKYTNKMLKGGIVNENERSKSRS
jgi:hypothetical protein